MKKPNRLHLSSAAAAVRARSTENILETLPTGQIVATCSHCEAVIVVPSITDYLAGWTTCDVCISQDGAA